MKRLKVYFIHSAKFDYNNLLYKKVLSSSVCLAHTLILPMTKEHQGKYAKELIDEADVVVAEISHPSFGLGLELKWLSKVDKPKLFLALDNKVPKKYQKLISNFVQTDLENTYLKTIEDFLTKYSNEIDNKDNSIILGQI